MFKVDLGKPQTGKTKRIVAWINDGNNRAVIVPLKSLKKIYIENYNLKECEVLSFDEVFTEGKGLDKTLWIDSLEEVIYSKIGKVKLAGISLVDYTELDYLTEAFPDELFYKN